MSKPHIHADSSARKFGGKSEDYLPIHQLMDSSKNGVADNRHRIFTHNSWFISVDGPLERIFGVTITNSDGNKVSVRDVGEQHILEDFGGRFIPTPQDYLEDMPYHEWLNAGKGEPPASHRSIEKNQKSHPLPELTPEQLEAIRKITKIDFDDNQRGHRWTERDIKRGPERGPYTID